MADPEFLTVEEIAAMLRTTPRWVRREGPAHGLPLYGPGRLTVGIRSEIVAWVRQYRIEP